jgi:hypothetical protein
LPKKNCTYGIACLSLAAKFHEIYTPTIHDYSYITDNADNCDVQSIVNAESDIFYQLGSLNIPNVVEYIDYIYNNITLEKTSTSGKIYELTKLLCVAYNFRYVDMLPSVLATTSFQIARMILCEDAVITETNIFGIPENVINHASHSVINMAKKVTQSNLDIKNLFKKFDINFDKIKLINDQLKTIYPNFMLKIEK